MGKALGVLALICSLSGAVILLFYFGYPYEPDFYQTIIYYITSPLPIVAIICGAIQMLIKDVPGDRSKTAIAGIVIGTGATLVHILILLAVIPT
ncbi:MAG: hypothetical protein ACFE8M_07435 [Candidatus Hermodarchaeota archaeon]